MPDVQKTEDVIASATLEAVTLLESEANESLASIAIDNKESLEAWRVEILGRNGRLTRILRSLGSVPQGERRKIGGMANNLKNSLESAYQMRHEAASDAKQGLKKNIDVTLPGRTRLQGRFHPITQTIRDLANAFTSLGFQIAEGPEIEWDHYNFTMLNIPPGHPARDMFDTFFIDHPPNHQGRRKVLRSHTSPMQARMMEKTDPPI